MVFGFRLEQKKDKIRKAFYSKAPANPFVEKKEESLTKRKVKEALVLGATLLLLEIPAS